MRSRRAIPLAVTVLAYVVAVVQRPGELVADTKVNLYLDPGRFLGDVLSLWSPTTDLGHVWAGQYAGYAWPMAPWFAARRRGSGCRRGSCTGCGSGRCWRWRAGASCGCWTPCSARSASAARCTSAAAVLFVVNPYVTVYFARQSIALLAYASLPWLLLCVHRGLREPRGWRWPIGVRAGADAARAAASTRG